MELTPKLLAYYLSKDRVLSLMNPATLPQSVLAALQGESIPMVSALLSNIVGSYILPAIATGEVKTLQHLVTEERLKEGMPFIYSGHFYGKGFGASNKTPNVLLYEKLDGILEGKRLEFKFSTGGLVNDTAYTRLSGSVKSLFAFGYVSSLTDDTISAIPYVLGDMVEGSSAFPSMLAPSLQIDPSDIEQFVGMDSQWMPTAKELNLLKHVPERQVKELLCNLLEEPSVPKDWGGEESDIFSANVRVDGRRQTAAFMLKGPAKFHEMTMKDCGANGDQIYRLFNIPADIYVLQHCHAVGAAVRKTMEAFAFERAFVQPCRFMIMDGYATANLLRANDQWPPSTSHKA